MYFYRSKSTLDGLKSVFNVFRRKLSLGAPLGVVGENNSRGGGGTPYKRLIGMWRWMGSHFHDWGDYNGVAFSIELLEWGRKFSDFWGE